MDDNARINAEGAPQATPSQPSVEDELRAACEELEAARRKLEELKAKYPPSTAEGQVADSAGAESVADVAGAEAAPSAQQPFEPQEAATQQAPGAQQPYGQQPDGAQQAQQQYAYQPYAQQPYTQQSYSQQDSAQQPGAQQAYNQYQPYQQPYYGAQVVRTKDHVAAGLLAIFLGSFGVHKFYLGYNSAGFVMLAVTIVGSLLTLGIAAGVMCIIAFIEGIIYLVKSQTDFEQLYVYNKREWF